MRMLHQRGRRLAAAALLCFICPCIVRAADETTFTKEQIKNFLLTAKVVKSQRSSIGITHPWRLTLTDGTVTHDASFQAVDEHAAMKQLSTGTEVGFVDSYKYNIAAYRLAEMLGLDDMLPVYVERKWQGNPGSISWWLPVKMDDEERQKKKLKAPDLDAWNNQMYKIRVFDQLVDDTDANLTNVLIGEDWKIWRVDFTRAFRSQKDLKDPQANLVRCDRQLLEKLKTLDAKEVAEKTKHYLDKDDVKAVMARRDKIVEHFQKLVTEKGENAVLY
jgi:hypothetical protein